MGENEGDIADDLFLKPPIKRPSMVTIGDLKSSHLSVFPPVNHEGLLDTSPHPPSQHESLQSPWFSPLQSTSSFSSSASSWSYPFSPDSDELDGLYPDAIPQSDPTNTKHCCAPALALDPPRTDLIQSRSKPSLAGWLGFSLEILRHKIVNSASLIPGQNVVIGAFRTFPLMSTFATVYFVSQVFSWVRRGMRRSRERKIEKLMGVIREKDEKIVKLLNQIARLNEVLIGHHHQRAQ